MVEKAKKDLDEDEIKQKIKNVEVAKKADERDIDKEEGVVRFDVFIVAIIILLF